MSKEIFHLHAEVCKTLANPKRLEILNILRDKEMSVGEIIKQMKISKANVSQHLAVLRKAGIVASRRDGLNLYYRITSEKVTKACDLMREVLLEHHLQREEVLKAAVEGS